MTWTSEAIRRTSPLSAMQRILIRIIPTIIITITQPVRLDANIRLLALQMLRWTRRVLWTPFVRLIRCNVVLAIVHSITDLRHWNATVVGAREFTIRTRWVVAVPFIGTVLAVVFVVALPRFEDASAVGATEFVG